MRSPLCGLPRKRERIILDIERMFPPIGRDLRGVLSISRILRRITLLSQVSPESAVLGKNSRYNGHFNSKCHPRGSLLLLTRHQRTPLLVIEDHQSDVPGGVLVHGGVGVQVGNGSFSLKQVRPPPP